jgi:hypothetical protein
VSHFERRLAQLRGQSNPRDLFSCPDLRCACGLCAVCDQPMHSEIHVGRGRIGGGGWRHAFRATVAA